MSNPVYPPDPHFKQLTRQQQDAHRFAELDSDTCQLCGAQGADKRSLFLECGYDVSESIPEAINIRLCGIESHKSGWYLRLCKSCRGRLLAYLGAWRNECLERQPIPKDHDGYLMEGE